MWFFPVHFRTKASVVISLFVPFQLFPESGKLNCVLYSFSFLFLFFIKAYSQPCGCFFFFFHIRCVCLVLQIKLLTNGFKLLRLGGLLVYSTCRCVPYSNPIFAKYSSLLLNLHAFTFCIISLTVSQNEDVVERFLKENASAGKILHS